MRMGRGSGGRLVTVLAFETVLKKRKRKRDKSVMCFQVCGYGGKPSPGADGETKDGKKDCGSFVASSFETVKESKDVF